MTTITLATPLPISYDFTPISPPGVAQETVTGINNLGEILGYTPYPTNEVFTYFNGSYTNISHTGLRYTAGINDLGQFVGTLHGVAFDIPTGFFYNGSTFQNIIGLSPSILTGINNSDQIVGYPALAGSPFLYSGGIVTDINGVPNGINNNGEIVGAGFLYINGTYTMLDDPLATNGTFATGINDTGQIVGYYQDAIGTKHGFFYSNGNYVTVDDPAGTAGTYLTGINNSGQIVGNYLDINGTHGFLATVTFSPENAGTIVYAAEHGALPDAAELNVLVQFTNPQYAYGQQIGVMDPAIYAYEALGLALASTAIHFQATFGPSNPTYPVSLSGDAQFAADAYASVFGHPGSSAQVQQFVDQLTYFETLYTAAGVFGSASNIVLLARGAVYGQMLGIEHEIDPTALGDPAGASHSQIIGISAPAAHIA